MAQSFFHKNDTLFKYIFVLLWAAVSGVLIAKSGFAAAIGILALPFALAFFYIFLKYPKTGIYSALVLSFMLPTFMRYVKGAIPFGLGVDILLVLTFLTIIFKYWRRTSFALSKNQAMLLMAVWMGYIVLELVNPLSPSFVAWFYVMRGFGLYQFLIMALAFTIFYKKKDFYQFLHLWMILSTIGALWAIKQKWFGVTAAEQAWLNAGAATTHILFGKLRIFSLYYDAGTYGVAMGQIVTIAGILLLGPYSLKRKAFYATVALFCFYGMILSGTRGALAVPGVGGILYLIMIRNTKIFVIGGTVLFLGFSFLKFTTIGNDNYDIKRLRSALDPEDASLNVRLVNRQRLTEYLRDKPFGGGLGTTGSWGQRFAPHTWLANFPPDGLYTAIRAETGLIGRNLYVGIWLFLLAKGVYLMWKLKKREHRTICMGLLAGYAGVLLANYGNPVMTQFPISLTTYLSVVFFMSAHRWSGEKDEEKAKRLDLKTKEEVELEELETTAP